MSHRTAYLLAWSLWGLPVVAVLLSAVLAALNRYELGFDWAFTTAAAAAFSSVIGLSDGVLASSTQYAFYGMVTDPGALPAAARVIEAAFGLSGVVFWLLVTFALLLFHDGRLPYRRWLPVA